MTSFPWLSIQQATISLDVYIFLSYKAWMIKLKMVGLTFKILFKNLKIFLDIFKNFTENDGQCFSCFTFFFSRWFFTFLSTGFVHFVNGESRSGCLVLFTLLVGTGSTVATASASAWRRSGRRVHSTTTAATAATTSTSFAFTSALSININLMYVYRPTSINHYQTMTNAKIVLYIRLCMCVIWILRSSGYRI